MQQQQWFDHDAVVGLEMLAVLYSLPYALLLWAMVTFLLAFGFECFLKHDPASTFILLAVWIVVSSLMLWYLKTTWNWGTPELSTANILKNVATDKVDIWSQWGAQMKGKMNAMAERYRERQKRTEGSQVVENSHERSSFSSV